MLETLQALLPGTPFVDAFNVGNVADIITSDSSLMPSMLETLRTLLPVTLH